MVEGARLLFSIITVCRNSGAALQKTIASVLGQVAQNYEYIIVDGNSTDDTLSVIRRFEPLFKGKMRWISESDSGIYNAMNKGARLAVGEYLLFLNADDWYESDCLSSIEARKKLAERADVFFGDCYFWDNDTSHRVVSRLDMLYLTMTIAHMTMAVSRATFLELNGFDERLRVAADWDFTLRAFLGNYSFVKYDGCHSNFILGGISSEKSNYLSELKGISEKNLLPRINLTYDEIERLYDIKDLQEHELGRLLGKSLEGPDATSQAKFMSHYALFLHHDMKMKIERYKNSKVWRMRASLLRLIGKKSG